MLQGPSQRLFVGPVHGFAYSFHTSMFYVHGSKLVIFLLWFLRGLCHFGKVFPTGRKVTVMMVNPGRKGPDDKQ